MCATRTAGRILLSALPLLLSAGCDPMQSAANGSDRLAAALVERSCTPPTSRIVINELMIDVNGDRCWVELHNPGGDSIDLQGWRLADADTMHPPFVGPAIVGPGGFATVCRSGDPARNGGIACDLVVPDLDLRREGLVRRVQVIDGVDVVDAVAYGNTHPVGRSVQLRHPYLDNGSLAFPEDPDDPEAWTASPWGIQATPGGSPNAPNDAVWAEQDAPECDDGLPCTWDLCIAGECDNSQARPGCCDSDAQCADGDADPCTRPACVDNGCADIPVPGCCTTHVDCIDDDPCTGDHCLAMRCRHVATDDGTCCWAAATDPVTGLPRTEAARREIASAACDDGNPCTEDTCDLAQNRCVFSVPLPGCCAGPLDCDDGDPCTYDICWSFTCRHPLKYGACCTNHAACDDANPCTRDLCILNNCRHLHDTGACCVDDAWCRLHFDDGDRCTDESCETDPLDGSRQCVRTLADPCRQALPYVQDFDDGRAPEALGWRTSIRGALGPMAWRIGDAASNPPGPHLTAAPGTLSPGGSATATTPVIDASSSTHDVGNRLRVTTAQWRLSWSHGPSTGPADLAIAASDTSTPDGPVLWQEVVSGDLADGLFSRQLPDSLWRSPNVSLVFRVGAPDNALLAGTVRIDDVRLAAGVPNQPYRLRTWRCPDVGPCFLNNATPLPDPPLAASFPLALGPCERAIVLVCLEDQDASDATWNYFGFPGAAVEGNPDEGPDLVRPMQGVTETNGCGTLDFAVRGLCGPGPTARAETFYCGFEVAPGCDEAATGPHRIGLRVLDESTVGKRPHSPFESLTFLDLTVTPPRTR